jgi:hypothetical protein
MTNNSEDTGIRGGDTQDRQNMVLEEHRAGQHAGRNRQIGCPHCYPQRSRRQQEGEEPLSPIQRGERLFIDISEIWMELARAEIERVLPKAMEYGSTDLEVLGRGLRALAPRTIVPDQELAIVFYVWGKVSRIMGAVADGRAPSDDAWHDLGVYARMVQIIRKRGGWMR